MNKKEQYEEDLLRKFINPERIEKAPEGFTSKTLARIQIEAQSSGLKKGFFFKNRLPLISAAVTAGFIIIALLIPASNKDSGSSAVWQYIRNIEITLPQISNDYLQNITLPGWVSYAVTALFLLVVFDRALFVFFHKGNNP
jgi:hypothetical protein